MTEVLASFPIAVIKDSYKSDLRVKFQVTLQGLVHHDGESKAAARRSYRCRSPSIPLGINYLSVSEGNRDWGLNYLEN